MIRRPLSLVSLQFQIIPNWEFRPRREGGLNFFDADGHHKVLICSGKMRCAFRNLLTHLTLLGISSATELSVFAQSPSDAAVRVSAEVQATPRRITLKWPSDSRSVAYSLSRKLPDATSWGAPLDLGVGTTSYIDTGVLSSDTYEYWISKWEVDTYAYAGEGYICVGIEAPLVEQRGKVVLIVDSSCAASLSNELARLVTDLVGDGWMVLRHDVPRSAVDPAETSPSAWSVRSNEVASVKALIKADYEADPANVKALFLVGHVPVPYSGDLFPDAHAEHKGAWPADGFYGDIDGVWTDVAVNRSTAGDPRNRNVPGDGKLDQTLWPPNGNGQAGLELQVGRVDFANLPAFAESEIDLLRRYLDKNHAFRHKSFIADRRGLVDDNLGPFGGEFPAANGWRSFAAFFDATNTVAADWLSVPAPLIYLWGFGCGSGTFTSCSGVASTSQLAVGEPGEPRVVFSMLFGSYFGDWDSRDNLLRATIATTNYTLASLWATRPPLHLHHMGVGKTIGFSTRVSQNNDGILYSANGFQRFVHVALMGDPTLRMHIVAPVSGVTAAANGVGGANVSWNASPDTVLGYHVYKSPVAAGPFARVNEHLITGTSYTDTNSPTPCVYMVRAVTLEVSGSGSYYNPSTGIFADFAGAGTKPVLVISALRTNKVYGAPLPAFEPIYSGFIDGDTPEDLDALPILGTTATSTSPVGDYPITVGSAASAKYDISYEESTLTILPAGTSGALASSANPALPGWPVALTMELSAVSPGTGTPTGSVQFKVDGVAVGGPTPLTAGVATYTSSSLGHGSHAISAEYTGDGNFLGCTNRMAGNQVINTPPIPGVDSIERSASGEVKVSVASLLANDSDADVDPVTFAGVAGISVHGGTITTRDGWVFYQPAAGFTEADAFTYFISDAYSEPVSGTVNVAIRADNLPSPNLAIRDLDDGTVAIRGDGIPGRIYRLEYATDARNPSWQLLDSLTADSSGFFMFFDTNASPQKFYRTVTP